MDTATLGPAAMLELEQRQLHHFLTDVRPVGEEKSELYPEPQYFNTAFVSVAAQLPGTIDKLIARAGGVEAYAQRLQRVLSPATALHMSGLAFLVTWGREMWLLNDPDADPATGIITAPGGLTLSDADTAKVLQFSYDIVRQYRRDGRAYPNDSGALGTDYRILSADEARSIAAATTSTDATAGGEVLGLLATVRALSFLMEAETREALMMHGPYPVGDDGHQLVLFECSDLHWSLFPNFPLPDGVRWELPEEPFPVGNIAIAMVLKDVEVSADRFGTLYVEPLAGENVVAASLLTRGTDAYTDTGLEQLPITEARSLRRHCDDIQEFLFLQIASWDLKHRMAAGVYQEHMLLLRMLAAAGYDRAEIEAAQQEIYASSSAIIDKFFDASLARKVEELPFYQKIGAFAGGTSETIFTPLSAAG
ncbi:MAG: hypothetical protein HKO62_11090 [Gammaproteobacteria bacterium]|nr:hypothetical protein [Gammaproteobacteria bacterium]